MSLDFQATNQLMAAFTSMHTTSMNACHALFQLAAAPEHVAPLREEIEMVLAEEGSITSKAAMLKLRKLDSFLRESQRLNPSSFGNTPSGPLNLQKVEVNSYSPI